MVEPFSFSLALPCEGPLMCRVCDVYSEEEYNFFVHLKHNLVFASCVCVFACVCVLRL